MLKPVLFICVTVALCSCTVQTDSKQKILSTAQASSGVELKNEEKNSDDSVQASKAATWLKMAIEGHFNSDNFPDSLISTPTYYQYKSDATSVGYAGGLTETEFTAKWKDVYDTRLAGMGTGFLISGQDYGRIKVLSCKLEPPVRADGFLFSVVIEDLDFKAKYKREIRVISAGSSFLIDDVHEYEAP